MQSIYNHIPEKNPVSRVQSVALFVFTICATCNVISPVKGYYYFYYFRKNSTSTELNGPMFTFLFCLSLYTRIIATLTSCVLQRFNPADFVRNLM